jgi:hypothetical protein
VPPDIPPFHANFDEKNFLSMPMTSMQMGVMRVLCIQSGEMTCLGTAFTIANFGLLATARHVVIDQALELSRRGEGLLAVVYVAPRVDRSTAEFMSGTVPVTRAVLSGTADVALLQVQLPTIDDRQIRFPAFQMISAPPPIGEPVMALGYSRMEANTLHHTTHETSLELEQDFNASRGTRRRR